MLQKALSTCVEAHHDQIDRDGLPHAFHCIRVGLKQDTERRMCIAFLHDVLEDCEGWTFHRLEDMFGHEIAMPVLLLTRGEDQSWGNYIRQILGEDYESAKPIWPGDRARWYAQRRAYEDAMHVKMADIEDNVSPRRLDDKMRRQLEMYHEGYKKIARRLGYTDKVLPL